MQRSLFTENSIKPAFKLLNREGSKFKYRHKIIEHFPKHKTYIEPFLGTGAIFFNKELSQYNILNDSSDFIYDFFKALENPQELREKIENALIYPLVIKENQDKLEYKIINILYSIYGSNSPSITMQSSNSKQKILLRLDQFSNHYKNYLSHAIIQKMDAFRFLNSIIFSKTNDPFVYCDPPYAISKGRLPDNKGWSLSKLKELIETLLSKEAPFAISEFNDKEVLDLFKEYNLQIVFISKATGVSSTFGYDKTEILAMNYQLS